MVFVIKFYLNSSRIRKLRALLQREPKPGLCLILKVSPLGPTSLSGLVPLLRTCCCTYLGIDPPVVRGFRTRSHTDALGTTSVQDFRNADVGAGEIA